MRSLEQILEEMTNSTIKDEIRIHFNATAAAIQEQEHELQGLREQLMHARAKVRQLLEDLALGPPHSRLRKAQRSSSHPPDRPSVQDHPSS